MSARMVLSRQQVAALERESEERVRVIVDRVLQAPDYPPLPACPTCGDRPSEIVSRVGEADFGDPNDGLLIDFRPCGHGFRVDPYSP